LKKVSDDLQLARFTTELLRIRTAATGGREVIAYRTASGDLNEAEFQQWSATCTGTIRILLELLPNGVLAVVEEFSEVRSAAHHKARAGTRYGLRRLAARQPRKTLFFTRAKTWDSLR
jgi:hypothetical protein